MPKPGGRGSRSLLTGAAIGVAIVIWVVLSVRGTPVSGPIEGASRGYGSTAHARAGEAWTFGVIDIARYPGAPPAVLDSVTALSVPPGLQILGYGIVGPSPRAAGIGATAGFPPRGYSLRPLAGFSVDAATVPLQVAVGVRAPGRGTFEVAGFVLAYHVGDRTYRAEYRGAIRLCVDISGTC